MGLTRLLPLKDCPFTLNALDVCFKCIYVKVMKFSELYYELTTGNTMLNQH